MHCFGIHTKLLLSRLSGAEFYLPFYKLLTIIVISHEATKELTIYALLCAHVTILYWQELASLFQVQEKFKVCINSK